jgi:nitroimidazol reductase NimA-like FMN-containing flavoprotein (pyridoxamine 5'-phosphate oxidase superfamily)
MLTVDRGTGLDHLGWQECLRLLATHPVGRVAVTVNGWPAIYPVNHHVVDYDTIVFRSEDVSTMTDLSRGVCVSLEVDGIDDGGELWSVTANGVGRAVDPAERARLRELGLESNAAGEKTHWIRITPETITGRRFGWLEWSAR